jgi:hypothetical protein
MPKKGYAPEQIINKLREAEILLSQGNTIGIVCKKIGVSDYTYYRWRKEYGGMRVDQARRLKDLEQENARLKKVVADFALITPFSKKPPGETSKPVKEKENGVPCLPGTGSLPKTGMSGTGSNQDNPVP